MSNYNCLTMMILRKCRANYEELTSLINMKPENPFVNFNSELARHLLILTAKR